MDKKFVPFIIYPQDKFHAANTLLSQLSTVKRVKLHIATTLFKMQNTEKKKLTVTIYFRFQ